MTVLTPMSDPEQVGRYRIVGRLGSGGMGWVLHGRSPSGRSVAVKVIRPEFADDPGFRERFAREIEAAKAVSGAFTAAVVDADPFGDPPWLATVHVPGPSLWEAVKTHGPMPEPQLATLGAGLVEALQNIHAAGVVHRDLKPSNVLLAEDGPRVIDFGISRRSGAEGLTQPGTVMGTPAYMSPEQIMADPVGPASDVFSLGAVLAFAATGIAPFGETEISAVLQRVTAEAPVLDGVPGGLRPLLGWCMTKDPRNRPSLDVLLDALTGNLPVEEDVHSNGPAWSESVAEDIRERSVENAVRQPPLRRHALALLAAGLTDEMVAAAVTRGR
ncbi:serine/threonine-protein kinase [Actinocorallia longicatena]|uniref:Protein kinase domain-containing protein n=1 Tax=Actinocorallia longicatena TaxID=111803 RepID=A0ABP6PUY3_9ACTN